MCLGSTEALAPRRHYSMQLTVHRVRGLSVAFGVSPFFAPPFGFCPAKRCTPPFSLPFCFRKLSMPVRLPSPFRLSLLALALTAAMHTTAVSGKDTPETGTGTSQAGTGGQPNNARTPNGSRQPDGTSLPDNASQSVNAGQPDAASDAAGSQSATSSSTADPTAAGNGTATSGASSDLQSSQGQGRFVLGEELPKKRSAGDGTTGQAGTGRRPERPGAEPGQRRRPDGFRPRCRQQRTGQCLPRNGLGKTHSPQLGTAQGLQVAELLGHVRQRPARHCRAAQVAESLEERPAQPGHPAGKDHHSGFIVPLDSSDSTTIEEFLLVPYFGACIHVPPPPSNQVIHVVPEKPLKGFQIMDPVTVQGVLAPSHIDTPLGSAGYQMSGKSVTLYEAEDMQEAKPAHP